jgi:glycosyltransferase involved in cell wall biosynthesis
MQDHTLILVDASHGVNVHRLMSPFWKLKDSHKILFAKTIGEIQTMDVTRIKQVYTSRIVTVNDYAKLRAWLNENNIRLIVDVDDYWRVPFHNPARVDFAKWVTKAIIDTLKIADIITTTNEYLANVVRKEIKTDAPIYLLNNAIDFDNPVWSTEKLELKDNGKLITKFGYLGAMGHNRDLALVGQTKKVYTITTNLDNYASMLSANYVFEAVDIDTYPRMYKAIDVSLVPLENTMFNRCKSDLKIAEAVATNTAVICSDISLYSQHIDNYVDGIVCKTRKDWKEAIAYLNKDIYLAREMADKLRAKLLDTFNIDNVNKKRVELLGIEPVVN